MVTECSILDQDTQPKGPHETCSWTRGKCCLSLLSEITLQDLFLVGKRTNLSSSSLTICLAMKDIPRLSPVAVENLILHLLLKTLQVGLPSSSGNDREFGRPYPTTAPEAAGKWATAAESRLKRSSESLPLNCLSHLVKWAHLGNFLMER